MLIIRPHLPICLMLIASGPVYAEEIANSGMVHITLGANETRVPLTVLSDRIKRELLASKKVALAVLKISGLSAIAQSDAVYDLYLTDRNDIKYDRATLEFVGSINAYGLPQHETGSTRAISLRVEAAMNHLLESKADFNRLQVILVPLTQSVIEATVDIGPMTLYSE